MDIGKIKEISKLKGKIESLKSDLEDLENRRREKIKKIIKEKESECAKYFEKYFDDKGFEVKDFGNILTAKYSTTKIVLKKADETKRRGHIRIYSKGALKIDMYVRISPIDLFYNEDEYEENITDIRSEELPSENKKDYVDKIEELENVKSEARKSISQIKSEVDYLLIDTNESNKEDVEKIKPLTYDTPFRIPKYNLSIEENHRYNSFPEVIEEKFE